MKGNINQPRSLPPFKKKCDTDNPLYARCPMKDINLVMI